MIANARSVFQVGGFAFELTTDPVRTLPIRLRGRSLLDRSASSGFDAEKRLDSMELRFELAPEGAIARWRCDVAELGAQLAVVDREVAPADDAVSPEKRHRVVAALALRGRCIGFEPIEPSPQKLEAPAVMDDGIERRQQAHGV